MCMKYDTHCQKKLNHIKKSCRHVQYGSLTRTLLFSCQQQFVTVTCYCSHQSFVQCFTLLEKIKPTLECFNTLPLTYRLRQVGFFSVLLWFSGQYQSDFYCWLRKPRLGSKANWAAVNWGKPLCVFQCACVSLCIHMCNR